MSSCSSRCAASGDSQWKLSIWCCKLNKKIKNCLHRNIYSTKCSTLSLYVHPIKIHWWHDASATQQQHIKCTKIERHFSGIICGRVCDEWSAGDQWHSACLLWMVQASLPPHCIGNEDETNAQIMWTGPGKGSGEWDMLTIKIILVFLDCFEKRLWILRKAPHNWLLLSLLCVLLLWQSTWQNCDESVGTD